MFYLERQKHKLALGKPALLVIDVQNYFFDRNSPAYLRDSERVLENIQRLLEILKGRLSIIATIHSAGSRNMEKWWGNIVESEWARPMIRKDYFDLVILKDTYDAFFNTSLDSYLRANNVDQLLITGVMTHLCCETTARSGFVRGYEIVMIEDCLWDKDEWYHFASLRNLAHGFALISSSSEIIDLFEKTR
ncbi:MAG: isochorismatase family cysteine hydrolase [Fervidobacterium sp.]|jgi:isochorismate hydrolase